MNPLITVLMSAFNAENYIKEAIESILNQSFKNFDFLIINDSSTDQTLEIIRSIKDARIKLINNKVNLGLTKSLNKGLKLAIGKYIARMDADDISHPDRLRLQVEFMEQHPDFGLCGSWYQYYSDEDRRLIKTISDPDKLKTGLLVKNQLGHPTAFIRKEVLDRYDLSYDEALPTSQDYNLWLKMSMVTKITNIARPLVKYRLHPGQIINVHKESSKPFTHKARINFLNSIGIKPTQQEEDVLYKSYFNEPIKVSEFHIIKGYFDKIIIWNQYEKVYKPDILEKVLGNKLKQILRNELSIQETFIKRGLVQLINDPVGVIKNLKFIKD